MGGGGGGDSYDAAYNARMADISEEQLAMGRAAFNSWNTGGGRAFEEAQWAAGRELLPHQTEFDKASLDFGMKSMGHKSGLMDKFYSKLGEHDEGTAVSQASADVASAISSSRANVARDAARRGVSAPTGGSGLDAAKLKVSAMNNARETTKARNLNELAMGMQI